MNTKQQETKSQKTNKPARRGRFKFEAEISKSETNSTINKKRQIQI